MLSTIERKNTVLYMYLQIPSLGKSKNFDIFIYI